MTPAADTSTFRLRLRTFAKSHFKSLRGLAEAADVNYSQLAEYDDASLPNGDTLRKLSAVGMNAHWLLTGEGTARQTASAATSLPATVTAEPRLPSYQVDPAIAEAMQTAPILDAGDAVARLRTLHSATAEVIEWMERQIKAEG